ncbi:hypothetical protein ACJX0J_028014, partial [Zea mays]
IWIDLAKVFFLQKIVFYEALALQCFRSLFMHTKLSMHLMTNRVGETLVNKQKSGVLQSLFGHAHALQSSSGDHVAKMLEDLKLTTLIAFYRFIVFVYYLCFFTFITLVSKLSNFITTKSCQIFTTLDNLFAIFNQHLDYFMNLI